MRSPICGIGLRKCWPHGCGRSSPANWPMRRSIIGAIDETSRRNVHCKLTSISRPRACKAGWPPIRLHRAAARNEDLLRLANALLELPDDLREVVILKHLRNVPLQQIADQTERTAASVAGLLRRGLAKLRVVLEDLK